eukprot:TRINITY_DN20789_c0_g1_i1.p1 TRINITY_DN20789_c0_g1~~TRINITY_DN20789_c0_g1_i1.p1  ORF type:complete len:548 (+),score=100.99 TRINITY_DN20789_c0_g1_i1:55-1698(+)
MPIPSHQSVMLMPVPSSGGEAKLQVEEDEPFNLALRESQAWLAKAHRAVLGTLEAEMQQMRHENMRLRAQLAQVLEQAKDGVVNVDSLLEQTDAAKKAPSLPPVSDSKEKPPEEHLEEPSSESAIIMPQPTTCANVMRAQTQTTSLTIGPGPGPTVQRAFQAQGSQSSPYSPATFQGVSQPSLTSTAAPVPAATTASVTSVSSALSSTTSAGARVAAATADLYSEAATGATNIVSLGDGTPKCRPSLEMPVGFPAYTTPAAKTGTMPGNLTTTFAEASPRIPTQSSSTFEATLQPAESGAIFSCPQADLQTSASPISTGSTAASVGQGQSQSAAPAHGVYDIVSSARALEAVMAFHGWQHLEVGLQGDVASASTGDMSVVISGVSLSVRFDSPATSTEKSSTSQGPPFRLIASDDNGRSWEALDALIRRRKLQKVVRTAPIATGTVEFVVEQSTISPEEEQSLDNVTHANVGADRSAVYLGVSTQQVLAERSVTLSLAELANMPLHRAAAPVTSPIASSHSPSHSSQVWRRNDGLPSFNAPTGWSLS